jgi:hypothetical protein
MTHRTGARHFTRASRWLALVVLCGFLGHTLALARATSLTVDEGLHIASGYTIWRTGDYRLIEEHPPLVKLWLALPLLPLRELPDPTTLLPWQDAAPPTTESLPLLQMAQQLLYPHTPFDRWLFPARAMVALLGILMLAVIYRWARDVGGSWGALFALALAAFDPNLLAHSALASTDVGTTTFISLALWRSVAFLRRPRVRSALAAGTLLGLALAAKSTALLLGPALGLAGLAGLVQGGPAYRRRLLETTALLLVTCACVFWATYGFQVGPVPGLSLPVPAAAHAVPILRLASHRAGGHQAFLLGENSTTGWVTYFPVAFLIKTPLPALLTMCVGACVTLVRSVGRGRRRGMVMARLPVPLFATIYIVASLLSPLNIGYRHLLPLLPLGYTAAAALLASRRISMAVSVVTRPRLQALGLPALAVLCILSQAGATLRHTPDLLPYANALVGGPEQVWRYLADSNTDWGQGYKALAAFQKARDIDRVNLAAFIFYDPAAYGVTYEPLPPTGGDTPAIFASRFAPPAGGYVISATPLDGIPLADPEMYDWFRWRAPDARVADALYYYDVGEEEAKTAWVVQCTQPAAPLGKDALAAGFGTTPPRQVAVDCARAWVIPNYSSGPGAYVVHGALLGDTLRNRLHIDPPQALEPFLARRLDAAGIAYRQRAYRSDPAFAVFRAAHADAPPTGGGARAGRAEASLAGIGMSPKVTGPIALDGPLAFLGTRSYGRGETFEVETWWRATSTPTTRPFSLMGHLLGADGVPVGVDDGLGVAPESLRVGDTLVVVHRFDLRGGTLGAWFRTGAYWIDTMDRWGVGDDADSIWVEGIAD